MTTTHALYGPIPESFLGELPQYTEDLHMAQVIVGYGSDPMQFVALVHVRYENGADAQDVERVSLQAGIVLDPNENFHAQRVSSDAALRLELIKAGYDAFAGQSVVENQEPFQVVVFSSEQAQLAPRLALRAGLSP